MTTYQIWMESNTAHPPFVRALFRAYLFADEEPDGGKSFRDLMDISFPGYFVTDRGKTPVSVRGCSGNVPGRG